MSLKDKAKTYNFWISLVSAVVLIVRIIGDKFNFIVDTSLIMDVTTGLCSIFVILGILSAPKIKESSPQVKDSNNKNNEQETVELDSNLEQTIETTNNNETTSKDQLVNNIETNKEEIDNNLTINNSDFENIKDSSDILIEGDIKQKEISDTKSLIVLIENLKAQIHKANMTIEKLNQKSE